MLGIIISIIATAIVSVLIAIWQMKKNRIDHYFINSYDIGKGLTDVFPEFQLHYGNEVLSKNVKVLQGRFTNSGRKDIGENDKQEKITMVLPEGCVLKDVKLSPIESGLVVEHAKMDEYKKGIIKKNEIVFRVMGLFKSKESFEYSAIIEVPENLPDITNNVRFQHRIANTDIKTPQPNPKQQLVFFMFCIINVIMFSAVLFSSLYFDRIREKLFKVPLSGCLLILLMIIALVMFIMIAIKILDSKNSMISPDD